MTIIDFARQNDEIKNDAHKGRSFESPDYAVHVRGPNGTAGTRGTVPEATA